MTNREIDDINKSIVKIKKKINRIELRDTIIGLVPGAVLVTSSTFYTLIHSENTVITYLYPYTLLGSIGLGMIPLELIVSKDTTKKYRTALKDKINVLHEEAIKENKIIQKKK